MNTTDIITHLFTICWT